MAKGGREVAETDGDLMVDPFGNLPEAAVDAWS